MAGGTTPAGTRNEEEAARWVERMFAAIAPRYDLLNHLLSFNIDRGWRRALEASLAGVMERRDAALLDVCCGTGDVLFDLDERGTARRIGVDFCHPMLVAARNKAQRRRSRAQFFEGDALSLPITAEAFDAVSIAFGFRNLAHYQAGLREFHRILKPDGVLAILEFSHPRNKMLNAAYGFYSRQVLPRIGGWLSGSREAYAYLPESIAKFPRAGILAAMMNEAGFGSVQYRLLSGGIAALHVAQKGS